MPPSSRHRQRVLSAADLDLRDVVGEHALKQVRRARPGRLDLAHVRDVEYADVLAHGGVLLAHSGVGDGHLEARERDELGARVAVALIERSAPQIGCDGHAPQASEARYG